MSISTFRLMAALVCAVMMPPSLRAQNVGAKAPLVTAVADGSPNELVLHNFVNGGTDPVDGLQPHAGLLVDYSGNLFGTTVFGGTLNNGGTVFELSPVSGGGWTEKVLHSFDGNAGGGDGYYPYGGLISDGKGNLFGTTSSGGANLYYGAVFELSSTTDGEWTEKILYSFGSSATDGSSPTGTLVLDAKGNLYGTTQTGGANAGANGVGYGTVFELSPSANGSWTEEILYNFGATSTDGITPVSGLIFDSIGNLYGTTKLGGEYTDRSSYGGTVFELSPHTGGSWAEKVLYDFDPLQTQGDGSIPMAGLVRDSKGNLYGTTQNGGNEDAGTVFELSPATGGTWTEKSFYLYTSSSSGYGPEAGVTIDSQGNLYGTTYEGGLYARPTVTGGTVFELIPQTDGAWTEKILHNFPATATDGNSLYGGVIFDSEGNLYGTTYLGGSYGVGTVFEIPSVIAPTAATPAFSPAAGTYSSAQLVKITDATPGATIYYTTNGTTPTTTSTKYTEAIMVDTSETIKAIATASGYSMSAVASETYTLKVATPAFSPAAGTYSSAQSVKITDATPGAAIYYTTNGTTPTTASTKYMAAIAVKSTETIKAIATATGYSTSSVVSATYTLKVATPTFVPVAGTYSSAQSVKITDSTPGVAIYYTTNGTTPTAASTKYTAAIAVKSTETIKAIATATGYAESTVASATYTIE